MSGQATTPEPGVYRDVAPEIYHAWDCASNSRLGKLVPPSTPSKLRSYLDEPQPEKKVWKEGRALHACVLEPERYAREYRVAGQCVGRTQKGVRCSKPGQFPVADGGEACHLHVDGFGLDDEVIVVNEATDTMVRACRKKISGHATAGGFLRVPDADYELSIVWDQTVADPETGEEITVRCKGRLDWYSETFMGGVAMDLKGIRSADLREFKRQAHYNGYLRQSVMYRLGLQSVGLPVRTFAAVAQEKEPPYELMVYMLGDAATGPLPRSGEPWTNVAEQFGALLRLWHHCETTGQWPGYDESPVELTTDEWAWSEMSHQTATITDFLRGRAA